MNVCVCVVVVGGGGHCQAVVRWQDRMALLVVPELKGGAQACILHFGQDLRAPSTPGDPPLSSGFLEHRSQQSIPPPSGSLLRLSTVHKRDVGLTTNSRDASPHIQTSCTSSY
jgi:hypothetical protein